MVIRLQLYPLVQAIEELLLSGRSKMIITNKPTFVNPLLSYPFTSRRIIRGLKPTFAKKKDSVDDLKSQKQVVLSLRVPNVLLARSAITVLGLGFIDAGYSGDWSRIGVLSKENEELLKIAAYVVVPLCLFLIFSFTKDEQQDA